MFFCKQIGLLGMILSAFLTQTSFAADEGTVQPGACESAATSAVRLATVKTADAIGSNHYGLLDQHVTTIPPQAPGGPVYDIDILPRGYPRIMSTPTPRVYAQPMNPRVFSSGTQRSTGGRPHPISPE